MKFITLFVLLGAAALAGCETTVDLPEPPHTPRVALQYLLTTAPQDSSFRELFGSRQLYVSKSQRVFSGDYFLGRADASVELRDAADQVVERYRPVGTGRNPQPGYPGDRGFYRPVLGFRPQAGQRYTLRATLPGLETAESTLTMPQPAVVESGTYVARAVAGPNSGMYRGRLTVVLQDDPAAANYYLVFARLLDQQGQPGSWQPLDLDWDSQANDVPGDQPQLSTPQQGYGTDIYPFADTNANGQRITMASDVQFSSSCYPPGPRCPGPGYIEVHVSSITREAYNFYLSRRRYYESTNNPFAEPAPVVSNVRSGYGLFGGATDATYRIRIF